MKFPRCYLVYAVAPENVSASEANDRVNSYIEDASRGLPAFHDHFTGGRHGGAVVLEIRTAEEEARLEDLGPLSGWDVAVHRLTFSLSGVGFAAQTELTIEAYGNTSLEQLRAAEPDDPRFWWRRARPP